MIYVAVMPVPIYVLALAVVAALLMRALFLRRDTDPLPLAVMTWITLTGTALALAALIFTSVDSISEQACYTGKFGVLGAQFVIGLQGIGFLCAVIARRSATIAWFGSHMGRVALIGIGQMLVTVVFARSAALCTV